MSTLLLWLACSRPSPRPPEPPQRAQSVRERLGDWPFLVPIDAPKAVALTAGGEIPVDPATCGSCHPDHLREWQNSTHARATRDLQYSAELSKQGQPRWLCLNCHLPTRPQRASMIREETLFASASSIERLEEIPEPDFDATRIAEAVACATCHVRRDTDGQGLVVGPRGSGRAPHRTRHDPSALEQICVRCHSPGPARISATFVCWFETADEIRSGPSPTARCAECHMPQTERPPAVGAETQQLRRHLWQGGGVPKDFESYTWLREIGWKSSLDVALSRDPLEVTLINTNAAHMLPTADPERHLRVEIRAESADGKVLAREVHRIGQTWDWGDEASGRTARRLQDSRLKPGEQRTIRPALPLDGAASVVVEATHVRLSPENAAYMTQAALDAEVASLWPEASERLPEISEHYPLATLIYRERLPLDGGPPVRDLPEVLLEESASWRNVPLEVLRERLGP